MTRHVLYAYIDGADLQGVAEVLDSRLAEFVEGRKWIAGRAWAVNKLHKDDAPLTDGDLPVWDLGINLQLPDPDKESPGWFADVEAIAAFVGTLRREFNRDFVIGMVDTQTGITDDLFDVSTDSPNLASLRALIGVGQIE